MNASPSVPIPVTPRASLLAEFATCTPAQWRTAAEALLKGAPFEKKLISRTPEGIELQPIYHADDVPIADHGRAHLRVKLGAWKISRDADEHPDARAASINVDTRAWHDAGASAVQELGFALAEGIERLRDKLGTGTTLCDATRQVRFSFSAGSNLFMEIAKLRAARLVWACAMHALGAEADACAIQLHVRTATRNKTAYDAHTNILRTTTEAFSAVVGGCDSLRIGAFDEFSSTTGEHAPRIAENIHHILAEECDLPRVADPAGGSYYVEWLTDQVARRAWSLFQEIERRGGMAAAVTLGYPQNLIAETARARAQAIATRRAVIVGVNQYPNGQETTPPRPANSSTRPCSREAEPFERLRDAAAAFALSNGSAPAIFQANLGPSRMYRLRADWTTGFFEVGGFKVFADRDFKDAGEATQAAFASKARVVVITAADETYPTVVEPLARAIKAKDAGIHVLVAGTAKDKDIEATWRTAGVDGFVSISSNALELLTRLLAHTGALS